jgi:hypothetical protein
MSGKLPSRAGIFVAAPLLFFSVLLPAVAGTVASPVTTDGELMPYAAILVNAADADMGHVSFASADHVTVLALPNDVVPYARVFLARRCAPSARHRFQMQHTKVQLPQAMGQLPQAMGPDGNSASECVGEY